VNAETTRAQSAEAVLAAALNTEVNRALAGEANAYQNAVTKVQTTLTGLANNLVNNGFQGQTATPTTFWEQIAAALYG